MASLAEARQIEPHDRAAWRAWLEANHAAVPGVWLVMRRRVEDRGGLDYEAAIEEALCFGWVDGTAGKVDDQRRKLYFARRKARSGWAATNKARVERLIAAGRMHAAGLAAIERAKANGSWTLFDGVERLEVPADLAAALKATSPAAENFAAFPPSVRKLALTSLALARRPETRAARVRKIAEAAARGERPG